MISKEKQDELHRRSLDLCKVFNPTDEDFIVQWDNDVVRIPGKNRDIGDGKGTALVYMYIAREYMRRMKDKILGEAQDKELARLIQKYEKAGVEDVLHKANQALLKMTNLRSDNPENIKRVYATLWGGVVKRYGVDEDVNMQVERMDTRKSADQSIFETLLSMDETPSQNSKTEQTETSATVDEAVA